MNIIPTNYLEQIESIKLAKVTTENAQTAYNVAEAEHDKAACDLDNARADERRLWNELRKAIGYSAIPA